MNKITYKLHFGSFGFLEFLFARVKHCTTRKTHKVKSTVYCTKISKKLGYVSYFYFDIYLILL
jgi:hypothetical protein